MHSYLKLSILDPNDSTQSMPVNTAAPARIFTIDSIVINFYANHYWLNYNDQDVPLQDEDLLQLKDQLLKVQLMGQQRLFNHLPEPNFDQQVAEPTSHYSTTEPPELISQAQTESLDFLLNSDFKVNLYNDEKN